MLKGNVRSQATAEDAGKRLDRFLAEKMPQASRARIQQWIRAGRVAIDQAPGKPSLKLRGTELISLDPGPAEPLNAFAEEIPLDILYEDEDLAAVNKPAGMTVHAGGGATSGTLVNALLHHFGELSAAGGELRPGIVHRLDRLTSGVLLIAKNDRSHRRLARQFQSRQVKKTYCALVHGDAARLHPKGRRVEADGQWWTRLETPVHRDRRQRAKMAAGRSGRSAQTDFRPLRRWPSFTLLEVRIATGRTHQIRVHLSSIGHPIVGDRLYGAPAAVAELPRLERFFLHARTIACRHPSTDAALEIEAPLPIEIQSVLDALDVQRSATLRQQESS